MAFHDWNHDGKNDWQDNYIEYQIYKHSTEKEDDYSYTPRSSGNGMSTFGAVLCTIASFFGAALIFTLLGVDVENVPVFVIIIVFAVVAGVIGVIGDSLGL